MFVHATGPEACCALHVLEAMQFASHVNKALYSALLDILAGGLMVLAHDVMEEQLLSVTYAIYVALYVCPHAVSAEQAILLQEHIMLHPDAGWHEGKLCTSAIPPVLCWYASQHTLVFAGPELFPTRHAEAFAPVMDIHVHHPHTDDWRH